MKTLTKAIALTATLIAVPTAAQAETFDGPYVGVAAGWDRAEVDDRIVGTLPLDADASQDSFLLGGYAGYNYKATENIVIGVEAAFSGAVDDEVITTSGGQALEIDPRYSFDLTARAGYLVTDKALLYVRGGYANQRVRTTLVNADGEFRDSENLDGWLVGGGLEYALTKKISARLEYRYSDLGNDGGEFDRHQTLVGVSYNF